MYIKGNKFYADWKDEDGHRRRKSFSTAKAALAYQGAQRKSNPIRAKRESRPSSSPLRTNMSKKQITTIHTERQESSQQQQATSTQANSQKHTHTKLTLLSAKAGTLIPRDGIHRRRQDGFSGGLRDTTVHQMSRNSSKGIPDLGREMSLPRKTRKSKF
jgi:hypothetical protein